MIGKSAKFGILASAIALAMPVGAQQDLSNPKSSFEDNNAERTWNGEVTRTDRGFLVGKPDAEATLIEFISYTCGHCATFAKEGDPAIDLTLLMPGEMNLEVRSVIRNELDLTISLLVACGDPKGFKARHRAFMWSQDTWLNKVTSAPRSQQAIWLRGDASGRMNAVTALELDKKLIAQGISRTEITDCLSDTKAAKALVDNSKADAVDFAVRGTPSFALDGKLLNGVHQWNALYPVLSERFKPRPSSDQGLSGGK